jgi:oligoribonuclease NrnB/cAMP/cGMP phosphodiesterase (DHH superfamily)
MKKYINNHKNLIISHIADADGISSALVGKMYLPDSDIILLEINEIKDVLSSLGKNSYEKIIVVDLPIRKDVRDLLIEKDELTSKIAHFDHHTSDLDENLPSYINIVYERDGKKECGATLLYEHLAEQYPNHPQSNSEYIKLWLDGVRSYDTEGPPTLNPIGMGITTQLELLGIDGYMSFYEKELNYNINTKISLPDSYKNFFPEEHLAIFKKEDEIIDDYISKVEENLVFLPFMYEEKECNAGVIISNQYRSVVGNKLAKKYANEVDFMLLIDMDRRQFSFRGIKDDLHLGKLAKSIHPLAGGQAKACGMPIDETTIYIIEQYIEQFKIQKLNTKKVK